MQELTIEEIKQ